MINLRYHIVSITAVFLALGIGIAMGSSFLGTALSDQVQRNIEDKRQEAAEARAERDELRSQLDRARGRDDDLMEQGAELLFREQLREVPVVVVTVGGVDDESLDTLRTALEGSQATFEGTITVRDKVVDEGAAEELADILGVEGATGAALQAALVDAVATEMVDHGAEENGGSPGDPRVPDVTRALVDAGYFDYEAAPGGREAETLLASDGYRYVIVTGPQPDVPDLSFLLPLVQAMATDDPAPVVVATAATGDDPVEVEETRTQALAPLREDDDVNGRITTVDDLETFEGVAAVVFGLEDLSRNRRGHYGVGDGSESLLPER